MSDPIRVAAVDLGASSGRVMVGTVASDGVALEEVHRFPHAAVRVRGGLYWDVLGLYQEVLAGLRAAAAGGPVHGIGIDSWAVDHGLLDADGALLDGVRSHRDPRTDGVADVVEAQVGAEELYAVTGIQRLPFNTVNQLVAARGTTALDVADTMLLLPDLFGYWLTGSIGAERTNASTTQLYDVRRGRWATEIAERLGLRPSLLPPLREAGEVLGPLLPDVAVDAGLPAGTPVIAVGSHDTASAVVGVPATTDRFAYVSSGTWSLVGLELDGPVLTDAAREADFTNEVGVDGTIRFLTNVMGLWVLSETVRHWSVTGPADLVALLDEAASAEPLRTVVDIDDPRLLPPGTADDPMSTRIETLAREAGEPAPMDRAALVRCILDSLALAYRRQVRRAAELAGRDVDVVHVVGGGARNRLLCRLTADACGRPVLAGPTEAAALGNVLVQARYLGADLPDLASMRALVGSSVELERHEPGHDLDWDGAERRLPTG